jgi:hypothetical protein
MAGVGAVAATCQRTARRDVARDGLVARSLIERSGTTRGGHQVAAGKRLNNCPAGSGDDNAEA